MNRDPRFALSQELEARQTLLDQLRALAAEDPDFLTDLIEGETDLLKLIAVLDASIINDEILVDGAKAALDKLQARKRSAENRIELKRRLLTHTLADGAAVVLAEIGQSSRYSGKSADCPRSAPSMKRFIRSRKSRGNNITSGVSHSLDPKQTRALPVTERR